MIDRKSFLLPILVFCGAWGAPAIAQDKALNLYSSRHYQTDEALYRNFTKLTGFVADFMRSASPSASGST